MKRSALLWIALAGLGLLLGACSDQNAPENRAHPDAWVLSHGSDPGASGSADDCTACHGAALDGGSSGVACLDCHMDGPPFGVHASTWGSNVEIAHLRFAEDFSWTTCSTEACHGTDLMGGHGSGETGPSCFTADCHSDGPPAPRAHREGAGEIVYADPALHGADAKGKRAEDGSLDPQSSQFYCRNCHGTPANDFGGGFVTASNYPGRRACTTCHPEAGAHPEDWIPGGGSSRHASAPEVAWVVGCGLCHEVPSQPGSNPLAGAPSCFADDFDGSSCHGVDGPGGVPHPLNDLWLVSSDDAGTSHVAASLQDAAGCLTCHVDLEVPPICSDCHTAGDPLSAANRPCISCHAQPPSDPGTAATARPDRQGAHGGHVGLTADTEDCSSCHGGAGTGTTSHWDTSPPATVAILAPTYQGKRGTAGYTFDAASGTGTCADVSCHGGQITPRWLDAALDVNQDCDQCHELGTGSGVPEANSYYSGSHERHTVAFGAECTACHDAGRLAAGGHFADLATAEFEGIPGETMGAGLGYDSAAQSCLTNVTGCHSGQLRSWSGAAHPVNSAWLLPSGTAATSHVLDSIRDRDPCISCHTLAGGGTDPACGVCHNAPSAIHFAAGQCDSCHNQPPDAGGPVGNERPNRAGAHGGHAGLTTDTGNCSSCHQGAGTDTAQHYDPSAPATVAILTDPYQGERGPAAYTSGTGACANISCHGGQTTPAWQDGSLTVDADCAECHELGPSPGGAPEANSYYSGRHETHIGYAAGTVPPSTPRCAACHDAAKLAASGHFSELDIPGFKEGAAAATMRDELDYEPTDQSCSVTLTGCHTGVRPWEVPHPVDAAWLRPSGNSDTSHVVASLANATECLNCHDTLAIPPLCTDCHKVIANDPLATAGTCVSCHADPPALASTAGEDYPQREGAHAEHDLLPGVVGNCAPCHTEAGTDTSLHMANGTLEAAPANVLFLSTYNAKNGTAARNGDGTCSAVRCHGGVLTPVWGSGSIDRANQCEVCHIQGTAFQTPQYNSPWSGEHNRNAHINAASLYAVRAGTSGCRMCHDASQLEPSAENHFSGLATPEFETLPGTTLRPEVDYDVNQSCSITTLAAPGGSVGCHESLDRESWFDDD